jgi:putative resolvase
VSSKSTMTSLLRLSKAADLLGVTTRTLRAWDTAGTIKVVRSPGGHRLIPVSEVERLRGEAANKRAVTIVYARCSTKKQEDNLERQVGRLLEHCADQGWKPELFKDIGSGLNDNRKQFKKMLRRILEPDVVRVVVEYKDRLCRYGFSVFQEYCLGLGVDVVILQEAESREFEQEFAEDVVALIASFSARLYGRRGGRKKKIISEE